MSTVIKWHKGVLGSPGVQQSYGLWYETVPVSGGARPDAGGSVYQMAAAGTVCCWGDVGLL